MLAHVGLAAVADASLLLVQPDPAVPATFVGHGGYSADGLGQNGTGGVVRAEVPAGSTVVQAYLYGTYFRNANPSLADRTIDLDGTMVVLTKLSQSSPGGSNLSTARADVKSQVATKVGGGGGITNFSVNTDPPSLDGVALVVIFSNPALPITTIALVDGGALQTGDTTTFNFSAPLDKTIAGFSAIMSVGSGFSFQQSGPPSHTCGVNSPQSSLIDINGARLTSCAGSFDDGLGNDGALITVGGVGDSITNPTNPLQQPADGTTPRVEDDELYNLASFMSQGDTQLVIKTSNPSTDDNLFLAVIAVTANAAVNRVGPPPCTQTLTGDLIGPFTANAGDHLCFTTARVVGPVTVKAGGALTVTNSQISRGIVASGSAYVSVCGSQVSGPSTTPSQGIVVSNSGGPIRIGDPADGCALNRVTGDISLTGNTGGIVLGANVVSGDVTVNSNAGSTVIKGNNIFKTLACSANSPTPVNAGQTNTAAAKTGQCATL